MTDETPSTEYPKALYKGDTVVTVLSAQEEAALGKGWMTGHEFFSPKTDPKPELKAEKSEPKAK